jgi:glycosyltransferase involved in cell wall biosynthesis
MKTVFYDHEPYLGGKEIATYQVLKYLNDKKNNIYAYTGEMSDIIREKIGQYAQIVNLNDTGDALECDTVIFCTIWHYTKQILGKKRVLWVHGLNPDTKSAIYSERFDDIVFVSETTKKFYEKKIPYKTNLHVIYNIVDIEYLKERASEFYPIKKGRDLTLVTVSRLSPEKGIPKLQFIASMLQRTNLHYMWYIVGGTRDEKYKAELKRIYKNYPNIHFMGEMENPHKIVGQCDFIVQLSNLETQNLAVLDGKLLGLTAILSELPAFKEFYPDEIYVHSGYGFTLMNEIKKRLKEPKKEYVYKVNKGKWKEIIYYGNNATNVKKKNENRTSSTSNTKKVSRSKK